MTATTTITSKHKRNYKTSIHPNYAIELQTKYIVQLLQIKNKQTSNGYLLSISDDAFDNQKMGHHIMHKQQTKDLYLSPEIVTCNDDGMLLKCFQLTLHSMNLLYLLVIK